MCAAVLALAAWLGRGPIVEVARAPRDPQTLPPDLSTERPCPSGGASFALGRPSVERRPPEFTTAGGVVFLRASGFSKGGIFDPEVGTTALYLGPAEIPPTYNAQSGQVTPTSVQSRLVEGTWRELPLDPGRYWLLTSNFAEITIRSCDGGITRVRPAPAPAFPTQPPATAPATGG